MKHQQLASGNIEQKTLIVFGFVLAVIIAVCALFYYTTIRFIENSRSVEHTHQVLHETEEAFSALKDAQSGSRGYIITGDERFLLPYKQSLNSIDKHFKEVRQLTLDNPAQQQRLNTLEPLVKSKIEILAQGVALRQSGDSLKAQEHVASGKGDDSMSAIRAVVIEMQAEEHRLLQERTAKLHSSQRSTFISLAFIIALFVVFFCIFYWLIRRDVVERKRAELRLKRETDFVSAIFENSRALGVVLDNEGRVVRFNKTSEQTSGYTFEDVKDKPFWDVLLSSDAKEKIKTIFLHLQAEDYPTTHENYWLSKDGEQRLISWSNSALFNADGEIEFIICTGVDITERKQAQDAMLESESRYRLLFDSNPHPTLVYDLKTLEILAVNDAAISKYGYSKTEFLSMTLKDLRSSADMPEFLENIKQAAAGINQTHTSRHLKKDGSFIEVEINAHSLIYKNKLARLVVATDITERRLAENALRASERRNRDLIDKSLGMISTHDLNGILLSVNKAAAQTLGYEPEEVLGTSLKNLIAPQVRHLFDNYLQEIREKGEASGLMVLVTKSGEQRTFAFNNTTCQEEGKPPFILGHAQDVTEMRRAEAEKSIAQRRLQFHLENSGIALIEWNKDWSIASWSQGAEKIFGWKALEIVGKKLSDGLKFVYEEDNVKVGEALALLSSGKSMVSPMTNRNYTKKGEIITCEWISSVQLDGNGEIISIMSLAHDITERERMQAELREARDAALESARLKSEFLANMSHEIRTPMNGVIGMSDLLFSTALNEEQREYAETIRTSAFSLLTIINDILDFSKIEAGKLHFETIDFDLLNTVESTVELFAEQAQGKRLEIASLVEANVPIGLRGDPGRLRQVLTNLVGNAVKFTESGEVVVHVRKESETEDTVMLRFSIRDTGIGIKEEAQKYLFQAFMQADGSTTRKYGGTGLGLAITKQLVELMEGRLNVESEFGKGSIFSFTARFEKQPVAKTKKRKQRTDLNDLRVLIVDDNATNRKILMHQVSSWGMVAADAESGASALDKLRAAEVEGTPFDLAVLDLMMPEMDGFELARRIKKDDSLAHTRLILMPSFGTRGHGAEARETGISGYLIKPVRQSDLFDCITTVMGDADFKQDAEAVELVTRHTIEENRFEEQKRILVAEDNLINQKVIKGQLERLGYRADLVDNGRKALAALEKRSYSLVLMDCQMPEMDGYAATKEIRRRESGVRHTPVVAVTANAMQGEREKCIAAGMDDYISKPLKIDNLKEVVARWLAARSVENTSLKGEENGKNNKTSINDLVDLECLQEVTDGDARMLNQIVSLYIQQTNEQLNDLAEAVSQNNGAEVYRLAHKSLGSSSTCGMKAMVQPLKELEQMGREENLAEAVEKLTEIRQCFQRLEVFLKEYLKQSDA